MMGRFDPAHKRLFVNRGLDALGTMDALDSGI